MSTPVRAMAGLAKPVASAAWILARAEVGLQPGPRLGEVSIPSGPASIPTRSLSRSSGADERVTTGIPPRRGELKTSLLVGLTYGPHEQVVLDPDQQVQQALRLFFETFRRTGSASATVRSFREQGLLFPRRLRWGPHKGEQAWGPLRHWTALCVLKNPRYAGAFVYGRRHTRWTQEGRERVHELGMAHTAPRRSPWLRQLGGVRGQPGPPIPDGQA